MGSKNFATYQKTLVVTDSLFNVMVQVISILNAQIPQLNLSKYIKFLYKNHSALANLPSKISKETSHYKKQEATKCLLYDYNVEIRKTFLREMNKSGSQFTNEDDYLNFLIYQSYFHIDFIVSFLKTTPNLFQNMKMHIRQSLYKIKIRCTNWIDKFLKFVRSIFLKLYNSLMLFKYHFFGDFIWLLYRIGVINIHSPILIWILSIMPFVGLGMDYQSMKGEEQSDLKAVEKAKTKNY
ncbi:MAG: hypothetical protein HeimC2_44280 [Candidatus Heimdallarchaeota archaeon LC_2]|nr:MAG: hypothetical protein HeimC2_44280 [Candidatus Heimdallarchaeota archaeon LC_2]